MKWIKSFLVILMAGIMIGVSMTPASASSYTNNTFEVYDDNTGGSGGNQGGQTGQNAGQSAGGSQVTPQPITQQLKADAAGMLPTPVQRALGLPTTSAHGWSAGSSWLLLIIGELLALIGLSAWTFVRYHRRTRE